MADLDRSPDELPPGFTITKQNLPEVLPVEDQPVLPGLRFQHFLWWLFKPGAKKLWSDLMRFLGDSGVIEYESKQSPSGRDVRVVVTRKSDSEVWVEYKKW